MFKERLGRTCGSSVLNVYILTEKLTTKLKFISTQAENVQNESTKLLAIIKKRDLPLEGERPWDLVPVCV